MAEESAQQLTGELEPNLTANRRASLQHDMSVEKRQQPEQTPLPVGNKWVLAFANLLCLGVAGMYVWSTHDLIGFIVLYGIATGEINAREVVGSLLSRHSETSGECEQ